jgi:hypothetical protein
MQRPDWYRPAFLTGNPVIGPGFFSLSSAITTFLFHYFSGRMGPITKIYYSLCQLA